MKQSDRIAALEVAVKELQEKVAALSGGAAPAPQATQETKPAASSNSAAGVWTVRIFDDGEWEWFTDITSGNRITFDSEEAAKQYSQRMWKVFQLVKAA